MSRIKLGVIGTGFMGRVHIANASASAIIDLVAIAGARGRPTRESLDVPVEGVSLLTVDELVQEESVEAVLVATRTSDHAAHGAEVLDHGKHLLLEKPGTANLSAHDRLEGIAARYPSRIARVAYHRRHDPRFRRLAEIIDSGAIGEPFAVHSISRETFPPGEDQTYTGGFILDVGVHDFDTAAWYLRQEPVQAAAVTQNPVFSNLDIDNAYVTITYAGGAVATVQLSRSSPVGHDIRCEVVGTKGFARLIDHASRTRFSVVTSDHREDFPTDCRDAFADAYRVMVEDFARHCKGEAAPGAGLKEDRHAVATAIAARASAMDGRPLRIGPDHEWTPPRYVASAP